MLCCEKILETETPLCDQAATRFQPGQAKRWRLFVFVFSSLVVVYAMHSVDITVSLWFLALYIK